MEGRRHQTDAELPQHPFRIAAGALHQKACLREDRFAGEERRGDVGQLLPGPVMLLIAGIEQGHQRAGIQDHLPLHFP